MQWPEFSLAEAINQAISASATIVGVFVGGWLAFRLGIRQLRQERAIDRRVESQEALLAAIEDYGILLSVLISSFATEGADAENDARMREYTLRETTDKGREVARLLSRADLYGAEDERAERRPLRIAQLEAYMASWTVFSDSSVKAAELVKLRAAAEVLKEQERLLTKRLRLELALPEAR